MWPVKTEWWGAVVVVCLERGADLHMAQLMPLPLNVFCFSKIQIGFTFLVHLTRVVPDKGPLNGCVCVCGQLISSSTSIESGNLFPCALHSSCTSRRTLRSRGRHANSTVWFRIEKK